MGQTAPRGTKSSEDLEGGQGVTVAEIPESNDDIVQEPVFGSPIDSKNSPSVSITYSSVTLSIVILYLQLLATSVQCLMQLML